jgi:hypothetical protein
VSRWQYDHEGSRRNAIGKLRAAGMGFALVTAVGLLLTMSHMGLGRVKTKSDLIVVPSGRRIFAFFCSTPW